MPTWLFTTGSTRGSFQAVEADGEVIDVIGVDLVLGSGDGETVEEAMKKVVEKISSERRVPKYLYDQKKIIAHLVTKSSWIDHNGALKESSVDVLKRITPQEEVKVTAPQRDAIGSYKAQVCQWCGDEVPSNGAAQFSHLKKHVNHLVEKNALTKEQGLAIRKIRLTPDMEKTFKEFFKR